MPLKWPKNFRRLAKPGIRDFSRTGRKNLTCIRLLRLACDRMPGMKDSKLVSAHDFWKSERPAHRKAAPKRGTERASQAFPVRRNTWGGRVFIVNLTSQSAAVAPDASTSLTPPLPTHSAIALVVNA